jgi:methylglutamate dehydrogenase subunit B
MRITCPVCGERDRREFSVRGTALARPDPSADLSVWDEYLHLRDNPAGETREFWYHEFGCSAWIVVTRDTVSHEVLGCELAGGAT